MLANVQVCCFSGEGGGGEHAPRTPWVDDTFHACYRGFCCFVLFCFSGGGRRGGGEACPQNHDIFHAQ